MKTIATIAGIAGILTFAATTTWLASTQGANAPDPLADSLADEHTSAHHPRKRSAVASRYATSVHRSARASSPATPPSLAAVAPAPADEPLGGPDQPEPSRPPSEYEHAQFQLLETVMGDEARDTRWAPQAEQEIAQLARNVLPEGVSLSTHCGSTLCRLELDTRDEAERDAAVDVLPQAIPWPSRGVYRADEHDPNRLVAFASREGYGLAEPVSP
ncbi:MAG: hypothetical protein AAGF11_31375 [Myxococcota bacterium]